MINLLIAWFQRDNCFFVSLTRFKFSLKHNFISVEDKCLPDLQHEFLRSEENVILNNFQHSRCKGISVSSNF